MGSTKKQGDFPTKNTLSGLFADELLPSFLLFALLG